MWWHIVIQQYKITSLGTVHNYIQSQTNKIKLCQILFKKTKTNLKTTKEHTCKYLKCFSTNLKRDK